MPRGGAARNGSVGGRLRRLLVAVGVAAAVAAPRAAAFAEDVQPSVSPDPIDDVPSTKQNPYPGRSTISPGALLSPWRGRH